ncbi:hypothetical protein LCGC14_1499370 [marine sediment metagenome]|uniref:Uncharacterized protein n=1 Tax=marine sediment metagenome TaxID=412755 RepID=A0A0F9JQD4_9ZZZZ
MDKKITKKMTKQEFLKRLNDIYDIKSVVANDHPEMDYSKEPPKVQNLRLYYIGDVHIGTYNKTYREGTIFPKR